MTVIDNDRTNHSDASVAAGNGVLGQRMLRKEDPALLTGEAVFTNDMKVPGALYLAVLRSPYAHAKIISIDTIGRRGARPACTACTPAPTWSISGRHRCRARGRSPTT